MRPDRRQVRGDAGLVVGGAAAVEPVAALGGLERLAVPVGRVADRLHVVVGVEQHGRRALGGRPAGDHGGGAPGGGQDLHVVEALGPEQLRGGLGGPPYVVGAGRVGADRRDPDQGLEVGAHGGHHVAHGGADRVRGLRHGDTLRTRSAGRARLSRRSSTGAGAAGGPRSERSPDASSRPSRSASTQSRSPDRERDPGRGVHLHGGRRRAPGVPGALRGTGRRRTAAPAPRPRRRAPWRRAARAGAWSAAGGRPRSASPARNRASAGPTTAGSAGRRRTGTTPVSSPAAGHGNHRRVVHRCNSCDSCYGW